MQSLQYHRTIQQTLITPNSDPKLIYLKKQISLNEIYYVRTNGLHITRGQDKHTDTHTDIMNTRLKGP